MALNIAVDACPVSGYRLLGLLGEGGYGQVWEAEAPGGMRIAMKFIRLDTGQADPELRALDTIRNVRHPHLLDLHFALQVENYLVIATSLCDKNLSDRLKECLDQKLPGIPPEELWRYMVETATAIDFLNEPRHADESGRKVSIQHRDIKPLNLLLVGDSIKVADFGLAKVFSNRMSTETHSMSPHYTAPERMDGRIAPSSDQYSLAVTYCELRTGTLPFTGSVYQVIYGSVNNEPNLSALPDGEKIVVRRALSKDPDARWANCREFVNKLKRPLQASMSSGSVLEVSTETLSGWSSQRDSLSEPASESPVDSQDVSSKSQPRPKRSWSSGRRRKRRSWLSPFMVLAALVVLAAAASVAYIAAERGNVGIVLVNPPADIERGENPDLNVEFVDVVEPEVATVSMLPETESQPDQKGSETETVPAAPMPAVFTFTVNPPLAEIAVLEGEATLRQNGTERTVTVPVGDDESVTKLVIVARMDGYEPMERLLVAEAGQTDAIDFTLVPLPAVYEFHVTPAGASVKHEGLAGEVDDSGELVQVRVLRPDGVTPIMVSATQAGYEPAELKFVPQPGESGRRELTLKAMPATLQVTVDPVSSKLTTMPADVRITAEGAERQLMLDRPDRFKTVTVFVTAEGYESHEFEWMPTIGSRSQKMLTLTPSPVKPVEPSPLVVPFDAAAARLAQQQWAAYAQSEVSSTNSIGVSLVLIPPGKFTIGLPGDAKRRANAIPAQEELVEKPFSLSTTEVTQAQWIQVMGTEPWTGVNLDTGEDYPAVYISWNDAQEFCRRLTALEVLDDHNLSGAIYRLPTEKEWEWACRAGSSGAFTCEEPEIEQHAWFSFTTGDGNVHPVARLAANRFGLHDMHGNVSEWCGDIYDSRNTTDDAPIPDNVKGILRGGSWNRTSTYIQSTARDSFSRDKGLPSSGFRIVKTK